MVGHSHSLVSQPCSCRGLPKESREPRRRCHATRTLRPQRVLTSQLHRPQQKRKLRLGRNHPKACPKLHGAGGSPGPCIPTPLSPSSGSRASRGQNGLVTAEDKGRGRVREKGREGLPHLSLERRGLVLRVGLLHFRGLLISLDSFSALTFSPLGAALVLGWLFVREKEEGEVRARCWGALDPLGAALLFFLLLAQAWVVGSGRPLAGKRLGRGWWWGPPLGTCPLQFGLLQGHLGLLECSLGRRGLPPWVSRPRPASARVLGTPGLLTLRLLGGAAALPSPCVAAPGAPWLPCGPCRLCCSPC